MTDTAVSPPQETQAPPTADYWGSEQYEKFFLPDGRQYFEFKVMNEGEKTKFEKMTNQDLIVNRDQSARVKVDPSEQRHSLITTSVTGWYLFKGGEIVAYSSQLLRKWLEVADPKVVADLEFAIRMANPWMQSEMSVEEIDKEIDRLHEVRKQVIDNEAGESGSATK